MEADQAMEQQRATDCENGVKNGSGSTSVAKSHKVQVNLSEGVWEFYTWIPVQKQGIFKNHRVAGRVTGNRLRNLRVSIQDDMDEMTKCVEIRTTKKRQLVILTVSSEQVNKLFTITFETNALILPVHFDYELKKMPPCCAASRLNLLEYHLDQIERRESIIVPQKSIVSDTTEDQDRDDSDDDGFEFQVKCELHAQEKRYDISWLERAFESTPIDDKLKLSRVLKQAEVDGWPSLHGACASSFDNSKGVEEMKRFSSYKQKARDLGLIRPFLLLVSMHPGRRVGWAVILDINIIRNENFGDAHWEALEILTHHSKGVVARASRTFRESLNPGSRKLDWYQILHRVLLSANTTKSPGIRKVFEKERMHPETKVQLSNAKISKSVSKDLVQQPDLACAPRNLENMYCDLIFQTMKTAPHRKEDEVSDPAVVEDAIEKAIRIVKETPEFAAKAELLRKHGFENEAHIAMAVLNSYHRKTNLIHLCEDKTTQETSLKWNGGWGSETDLYDEEFKETIKKKMKKEKRLNNAEVALGSAIPILLCSLAVTSPIFAAIMVSRAAARAKYPYLPTSLTSCICSLVIQRYWLAINDISIEAYY